MGESAETAPNVITDVYAGLLEPDRVWLRARAAQLRAHLGRTVREIVECGDLLRKARRRLGRGLWRPWLLNEAQVAARTAYRYMRVAGAFRDVGTDVLDRFSPGALYALADTGCPAELRAYAIEQAGDGVSVTCPVLEEWAGAFREPLQVKISLASSDPAPPKPESADVRAPENWRLLRTLFADGNATLHISQIEDSENGERLVSVVVLPAAGGRRSVTAPTLEEAIAEAAGAKREKQCRGPCKEVKSLYQFSHSKISRDGRNKYCLACERARVNRYLSKKHAGAKADVLPFPAPAGSVVTSSSGGPVSAPR